MKQIIIFSLLATAIFSTVRAQNYITRNGNVSIFSHTPLEDIKAQNNEAVSVLNSATGDIEFKVAVKSFHFPKASMEEHFNTDDYMDSEKYPKAGFKGKINKLSEVNFAKDGTYKVTVQGDLTMKDATKSITAQGIITVGGGVVTAQSTFTINRKDFHIIGESYVQKRIAEQIEITVNCKYDKR
ncbi:MAG: YceI family protein [Parafilimonas sp.]